MNLLTRYLLLTFALAAPLAAYAKPPAATAKPPAAPVEPPAPAATSMLRVVCEGDDAGAEVSVNGKFKGECPIDMQVAPGMLTLRVEKKDPSYVRVFEQEIRMGDGVVKKVEAVLSRNLNAAGQQRENERLVAQQQREARRLQAENAPPVDNGDGTITAPATGLTFLKNPPCFDDAQIYSEAISAVKNLSSGSCGLTDGSRTGDWRLPTDSELKYLGMKLKEWKERGLKSIELQKYKDGPLKGQFRSVSVSSDLPIDGIAMDLNLTDFQYSCCGFSQTHPDWKEKFMPIRYGKKMFEE